jgi:hypothetical protein
LIKKQAQSAHKKMFEQGESIEFSGKVIAKMAQDPAIMSYTSKVVIIAEYAQKHGIKDIDQRVIPSLRQVNGLAKMVLPSSLTFLADFIPNFVRVPQFVLDIANSKF